MASLGREKLDERATAKKAWKFWQRTRELISLMLNADQLRRLIAALGGWAPVDPEHLVEGVDGVNEGAGWCAARSCSTLTRRPS